MRLEEFYKGIVDTMKMLSKNRDEFVSLRTVLASFGIDEFSRGFHYHDEERMVKGIIVAKIIDVGYYYSAPEIRTVANDVRYYLSRVKWITPEWLDELYKKVVDLIYFIRRSKELYNK